MKKIITCLAIMLAMTTFAMAQTYSLEQCIEHAIANNLQIKMEEANRDSKAIDLNTARRSWLPNLNASADQSFNFGRSTGADNVTVNQNSATTSLSLSTSMPLFTGFQITNDIKVKRYNVQAAEESLKRAKENIAIAVAQTFLDVLLRNEICKISEENLSLTNESLKRTEIMVTAGQVPPAQLYEMKSQQASDEAKLTSAKNELTIGMLTLAQLLELTEIENFDIAAPPLDSTKLANEAIPSSANIYSDALTAKPQIREAELQLESSKATLKTAQSGHYPQLSLNAGLSDGYYYQNSALVNEGFSTQMNGNLQEYVGVRLSIPIFNRFATRNNVRAARVGIAYQQLVLEDVKKTLYKEIQQAYHNAVAAQKNYRAAQKSVEAAREAFRYANTKYHTGKSSVYEFTEARTNLTRSLSEEAQAKFNYVFAVKILNFYSGTTITL
ncbi:transporter [Bacteroidia bacterium]|nr:transporter [Bacteroidia bacterium]